MKWEPLESWNEWDDCHCTGIKNDRISCSTACGTAHIRLHIREADMSLWCLQENKSLLGHEKKKKKNLTKRSMTHRWPLTHFCWGHMCDSTQGSLYPSPMKICQSMWIQWPFFKILEQRSLTPWWPLTPSLLRSYVWLYPRIIESKSHENTSKYVDTVTLFSKPWTKGHWPLDDLWPRICWGHMCDSSSSWAWFFSLFFIRKFHIELCHSRPTTYFAAPKKTAIFIYDILTSK